MTEADFIQYMIDHRLTPRLGDFALNRTPRDDEAYFAQYARFLDGEGARRDGVPVVLPGAAITSFSFEPHWREGSTVRESHLYTDWLAAMQPEWKARAFDYTCDEPANAGSECFGGSQIPVRAAIVPDDIPTLVTAPNKEPPVNGNLCGDDFIQAYAPSINIAVANSVHIANMTDADAFTGLDQCPGSEVRDVWMYQSCSVHACGGELTDLSGQPSLMVDVGCTTPDGSPVSCGDLVSGAQNRTLQWLSYYYGFTGELYYDFMAAFIAMPDSWSGVYYSGGNGDGTLLYPWSQTHVGGQTRIPVPSYRLKILRDGMEDYEYLVILDSMCHGAGEANAIIEALFGTPVETRHANVPVAHFIAVRNSMANRIASLNSGSALCLDGSPPQPRDPPPPAGCNCTGTGTKCFDQFGDWWWSGQRCENGQCVARACPPSE